MSTNAYDSARAAQFFADRLAFTTGTHELEVLIRSKDDAGRYQVVDVRFPDDFAQGHVPGAINLPMAKWDNTRLIEEHFDKDATLYLYCYTPTCHLAAQAAVKLDEGRLPRGRGRRRLGRLEKRGYPVEKLAEAKLA